VKTLFLVAALCVSALAGGVARAQVIAEQAPPPFPDAKKFARGFYAQGDLGALTFVGGNAGKYAGAGEAFGVRLGYDLLRWLSIQGHLIGSSAESRLPGPDHGQAYQTLVYAAEAHGQVQIRRVGLYAEAGAGISQIPSNILDAAGVTDGHHFSLAVIAGGGIEYHTLNRHFAFGAGADYLWLADFGKSSAIAAQAFFKYTR
jgi:Outer membrane protein beta-barrel domain